MPNLTEEELLKKYKNLIESETRKYATHLPHSIVLVEAYKLARQAAKDFDPKLGFQFSTFLVNRLQKLSRISTQYGSAARIPEDKQFKMVKLNQAEAELTAELGREPTVSEIADSAHLSISAVKDLLSRRKGEVNIGNLQYTPIFTGPANDEWVHFVYHDLPQRDKVIFEHKTGFAGREILDNATLAKKLNTSTTTVASRIKLISEKLAKGWED